MIRFEQEFGRDAASAEEDVTDFCRANQLSVQFIPEKSSYLFQKVG
jgi:hypothetical protein